jgi:hypothetical protein
VSEKVGERGRNRTYNLLIKSQLLCQLSYAPGRTAREGRQWIITSHRERLRAAQKIKALVRRRVSRMIAGRQILTAGQKLSLQPGQIYSLVK